MAIIIVGFGGYFYFQLSEPIPEEIPELEPYSLEYEAWEHTTNTEHAYFKRYDISAEEPNKILLFDASSQAKISASLKFVKIGTGEILLQFETYGDPEDNYKAEMYIDFKSEGNVLFSLERRKFGDFVFSVDRHLIQLQDHTLSKLTFKLKWVLNETNKYIEGEMKRIKALKFRENVYTKATSIDEIQIYTTLGTVNSGTIFYFDTSYLKKL